MKYLKYSSNQELTILLVCNKLDKCCNAKVYNEREDDVYPNSPDKLTFYQLCH